MKTVIRRGRADQDIAEAVDTYFEAGEQVLALDFADALRKSVAQISQVPGIGSPRLADILQIEDLRVWPVDRFPYLIFYIETLECIDVVRVLHERRDIRALFL